jgi:hypothetical protein
MELQIIGDIIYFDGIPVATITVDEGTLRENFVELITNGLED